MAKCIERKARACKAQDRRLYATAALLYELGTGVAREYPTGSAQSPAQYESACAGAISGHWRAVQPFQLFRSVQLRGGRRDGATKRRRLRFGRNVFHSLNQFRYRVAVWLTLYIFYNLCQKIPYTKSSIFGLFFMLCTISFLKLRKVSKAVFFIPSGRYSPTDSLER